MSRLAVSLFGHIRVEVDGHPVDLKARKVLALLGWLVANPRPHSRERIATMLWPEVDATRARANLRRALWLMNQDQLGHWIDATPETVTFVRDETEIDVVRFDAIVGGADPTLGELAAAVELYAGDFLDDLVLYDCEEWSAWARDRREDYRRQALGALQRLAQAHLDQGNAGVAERYARRQIELDHLDERAYQQLFLALARGGQRTTALGEYEALRRLLKNELSAPPSQVTDEIIAQIRTGALDGDTVTAKTEVDDREKSAAAAEAEIAPSAGPVPSSASGASNPYRGLFTFREEDAADFFGREEFIDQLITAVYQRPLAAVVGPSGSGKSSVIHAGLIPVLRQEHGWIIATFRPGRRPYHALAGALMPLFEAEQSETDRLLAVGRLADGLEQVPLPLMEVLERIRERQNGDPPQGSPARFLLVIDQFEELYTLGAEAAFRERFLDTLLKAVFDQQHRPSPSFTLVFALRADFLGQMLAYRPLADALTDGDAKLGPMRRAEMTRAIVNPAHLRGVAFEPGLVARILDDVHEEPGGLPLLQFALDMLWMEQEENQLSHRAYERIGRVHGALARHAETVYADLDERDQPLARRIFVQVVRPGLSTEDTRRLATRSEIGDEAWSLVQRLADSRLLVTNRDDAGQETVEVVHEALIRGWQRLQDWLRTDREFRLWQERLRGAMAQWGASQYDDGALLRGRPLSEAEGWLVDREADLSTTESEYIQASIDYRDERRAEAARIHEEQRQRELAAARSLTIEAEARRVAEAQHAAEAEARASEQAAAATQLRRRARWLAFASLVTIGFAAATALFAAQAHRNANQAVQQAQLALVRHLRTEMADAQSSGDTDLALLLATEGARRADPLSASGVETMATLHRLLNTPRPVVRSLGERQDGPVTTGIWSGDGRRVVTTDMNGVVRIWDSTSGAEVARLTGHQASIRPLGWPEWDEEGRRLLTSSDDGTAMIWDIAPVPTSRHADAPLPYTEQKAARLTLAGHTRPVTQARWSPDHARVATVSPDGTMRVWDATTGVELVRARDGDEPHGPSVAWSSDGTRILTPGVDGIARVWDAESGKVILSLQGHQGPAFDAKWSHAGDRIATSGLDGTARIWDAQSGGLLHTLAGHSEPVQQVLWNKDDTELLSTSLDGTARVWNTNTGEQLRIFAGHEGPLRMAEWSPDENLIVTAGADGTARVWNAKSNSNQSEQLTVLGHGDAVSNARWSPDGTKLLTVSRDGLARIWQWNEWEITPELPAYDEPQMKISNAVWNADKSDLYFARGTPPFQIYHWDNQSAKTRVIHTQPHPIRHLALNEQGSRLLVAGSDGIVHVLATVDGSELMRLTGYEGEVYQARWDQSERRILTAGSDGTVRVWDAATGSELLRLTGHDAAVRWAIWNSAGDRILSADDDGRALIWDATTGDLLLTLEGHSGGIRQALWNQDETAVLTAGADGTARLWDVTESNTPQGVVDAVTVLAHEDEVVHLAWNGREDRILTASADGRVRIWSAETQGLDVTPVTVLGDAGIGLDYAAWNADETLVAAVDEHGGIRVWDIATGELRQQIDHLVTASDEGVQGESRGNTRHVEWNEDGDRLLVISSGVFQYHTQLDALIDEACRRLPRNLSLTEWQAAVGDEPYRATCANLPMPPDPVDRPPLPDSRFTSALASGPQAKGMRTTK